MYKSDESITGPLTRCRIFSDKKGRIMAKTGWKNMGSLMRWIPLTFSGKESWMNNQGQRVTCCPLTAIQVVQRESKTWYSTDSTEDIFLARKGLNCRAWPKVHPWRSNMTFRPRLCVSVSMEMISDVMRLTRNTWKADQSLGLHWPAHTQRWGHVSNTKSHNDKVTFCTNQSYK